MLTPNDVRNLITLDGHLAKDPEILVGENGKKVAKLSVATNEKFRKNEADKELTTVTDYHDVVAWNNNAEYAEKFLKKGAHVIVWGKLRSNRKNETPEKTYYNTFVSVSVLNGITRTGGVAEEKGEVADDSQQ